MATQVIRLPLNSGIKRHLSSGKYDTTVQHTLGYLDLLYTYVFRYPRLFAVDIQKTANTQGFAIDYTAANPTVGATITALFLLLAVTNVMSDYQKQKQEDEEKADQYRETYKHVHTHLQNASNYRVGEAKVVAIDEAAMQNRLVEINKHFNDILNNSPEAESLRKKYRHIEITASGHIDLVKNEAFEEKQTFLQKLGAKLVTIAAAFWAALGLASFVYWILWIGWGAVTGNFASAGVGSSGAYGFIIPLLAGALYPLIKMGNWLRNHFFKQKDIVQGQDVEITQNVQEKLDAAADISKLLRRVVYTKEKSRLEAELKTAGKEIPVVQAVNANSAETLATDKKILKLGKHQWRKTAATFVAVAIASYIGAQYAAWVVRDALQVVVNVSLDTVACAMGFGIAFIALSAVYGLHQAYQKHKEVEKYRIESRKISHELIQHKGSLEKIYEDKLKEISTLTGVVYNLSHKVSDHAWLDNQSKQFAGSKIVPAEQPPKAAKTWRTKLKKAGQHAYAFFNGLTGGAMIGRVATIAGTAVFLPFAAAALANPFTIAIIVTSAVTYGAFKMFQYNQDKKEARAKALLEARQEKISCLKQQIELADMQIKVLQAKRDVLRAERPVSPSGAANQRTYSHEEPASLNKHSMFQRRSSWDDGDQAHRPNSAASL